MAVLNVAGTQLLSTTLGVKEYVQNEFLKVEKEVILPNKQLFPFTLTKDDFFWAFGMLRSRAFSRLRNQNLVVIPFADLVKSLLSSTTFTLCISNRFSEQLNPVIKIFTVSVKSRKQM